MEKFGLHSLKLVLAPFSNQEGEWLWTDEAVRSLAAESKLYMIGQRREVFFENIEANEEARNLTFDLGSESDRTNRHCPST